MNHSSSIIVSTLQKVNISVKDQNWPSLNFTPILVCLDEIQFVCMKKRNKRFNIWSSYYAILPGTLQQILLFFQGLSINRLPSIRQNLQYSRFCFIVKVSIILFFLSRKLRRSRRKSSPHLARSDFMQICSDVWELFGMVSKCEEWKRA